MLVPQAQLNKQLWDLRVLKDKPEGFFFMLSWYLDAVFPNWEGYVIGEYEAIYPIVPQRKYYYRYSLMPFLTRSFNPIGFNSKQLDELVAYLRQNFSYFQLSGLRQTPNIEALKRHFQVLDLVGYDLQKCSENHKRQFKKASKQGFIIKKDSNPEILIQLFRKVKGVEFKHLKKQHYLILQRLMDEAKQRGVLRQFSLFKEDILIGAAAYLEIEDEVLYLKGAVEPSYMRTGAMVFLHLTAIQAFVGTCKQFDFGGSNAVGLSEFNRKFGARDQEYLLLKQNKLPWPLSRVFKAKFG